MGTPQYFRETPSCAPQENMGVLQSQLLGPQFDCKQPLREQIQRAAFMIQNRPKRRHQKCLRLLLGLCILHSILLRIGRSRCCIVAL